MGTATLSLGINVQDIFTLVSTLFTAFWPLFVVGAAVILAPFIMRKMRGMLPK